MLGTSPAKILEIELARQQTKKMDAIKNDLSNSNDDKSELLLLQADCTADSFVQKELCDVASIISMPQIVDKLDIIVPEPIT
ncbi:hypothetical protein, partial [Klebsiella pneumoniae]|uniref:hypothetical protein n=1 Tax=Klebsiella pneumoniae TaxID=573 RepID=UPI0024DEEAE9